MIGKQTLAAAAVCVSSVTALFFFGCSGDQTRPDRTPNNGTGGSGGVHLGVGGDVIGVGGFGLGDGGLDNCGTSISGTVYDPAGKLPLYNVVVYAPSTPLDPINDGASCQTCDGNFSGTPVAAALSDAAGNFRLCLDRVTARTNVSIVVQIGKWRREITIPTLAPGNNPQAAGTIRLPRDRSEGHLPHIAVVRGGSDALECLFRKIGIADSEFTIDTGDGRVHLYASSGGSAEAGTTQLADGSAIPLPAGLYGNLDKMMTYDALFLACEGGGRGTFEIYGDPEYSNIYSYTNRGGRIFGSHYHNYWVRPDKIDPVSPIPPLTVTYPAVATFASSQHGFGVDVTADVDASFPKGEALRDWLVNVGASTTPGKLLIHDGEHTVDAVIPGVSTQWVTVNPDTDGHTGVVQYFSFNTPVGQAECGRMVFSDLHVAAGTGDSGKIAFPNGCVSTDLSPQEKALAFMLFDISNCVQPDDAPVVPPILH